MRKSQTVGDMDLNLLVGNKRLIWYKNRPIYLEIGISVFILCISIKHAQ